jgi:DNA-binding transcriptional MocR family regulator
MGFTGLQAGEGCMICTICWTGLPKGMQFWLGQPSGCADVAAQELAEQAAASGLQLS